MILIHSLDAVVPAERILRACGSDNDVRVVAREELASDVMRARCIVIGCAAFTVAVAVFLYELGRTCPGVPVVLVIPHPQHGLTRETDGILRVVTLDRIERDLPKAIAESGGLGSFLLQCATFVADLDHLPDRLRDPIAHAFRARPPVQYVTRLLTRAGIKWTAFHQAWSDHIESNLHRIDGSGDGAASRFHPHDLLCTVIAGRAIDARGSKQTWEEVEAQLGVTERAIRRHARKVPGLSSGLADARDPDRFRDHVERTWIRLFAGPDERCR